MIIAALTRKAAPALKSSLLQRASMGTKLTMQSRGLFNLNGPTAIRQFSSLPDHIKLEMPNLSPTMEKVSNLMLMTCRVTSAAGV